MKTIITNKLKFTIRTLLKFIIKLIFLSIYCYVSTLKNNEFLLKIKSDIPVYS